MLIDTLTDTATVNFGWASFLSESKKSNIIEVVELIYGRFPLGIFVKFRFSEFASVKRKFALIAKKLTSIGSFNIKLLKICLLQLAPHSLHIWQKWVQALMNASEITALFLPAMDCVKRYLQIQPSKGVLQNRSYLLERAVKLQVSGHYSYYCNVDHPRCSRVLGSLSGICA